MILQLDNVGFGYHRIPLFERVDYRLTLGKVLRLVGPNGTGKSTLMRVIAGLLSPERGAIRFLNADESPIPDRRTVIEYLPAENNGLFTKLGAVENLSFWAKFRNQTVSREKILAALEVWGLNHPMFREKFAVEQFSTGMKRRLALARVSLSSAPFWLLDEPLFGLDQGAIEVLRTVIQGHIEAGGGCVMVSHETSIFNGLPHEAIDLKDFGVSSQER